MAAESSREIDGENPSLSGISHASRAFSLAARRGSLANYLKLTALRKSLSLRDLGRWD